MHEDAVSGENRKPAIVIPMEADFLYVYSTADGKLFRAAQSTLMPTESE
jgi:hypothetical protein